jgi:tetratricopeptide (TPR) repeat protein
LKRVPLVRRRVESRVAKANPSVNDSDMSRFAIDTRALRCLRAALVAVAALLFAIPTSIAQQVPSQDSTGAIIQGSVNDSAGNSVANASVQLEETAARNPLETKTSAAGAFTFSALPTGTYKLTAEKSGLRSAAAAIVIGSNVDRRHVDLVLETNAATRSLSPAQSMGFSDSPNFTVAGVTDWTAVGGHGSDFILRTSEDLAREAVALKPKDGEPGTSESAGSAKEGESEGNLRTALAGAPGSFDANHQLGEYYLHAGRYRESLPLLEAAYRLDPANDSNERDLALAYERTGDLKQAREQVDKLLKRKNDAGLHRMAAELDEKLGDPLGAVQEDQRAVALAPSEENYFAWGSELLLHRAVWQAADVFRNGIKAHPNSVRLLTGLGTALFAGAAYDEAARNLCAASDLDPSNQEPYIFMGKVAMAAPAPLPCIEAKLARFAKEEPDSSIANYLYAMAIWKRQQSSAGNPVVHDVETLLTKAVTIDPRCSDGFLQLGILAASQQSYEKAIQLYAKASEVNPQLAEAHYRLGVAYEHLGERDKAQQEFQLHDQIEKRQADAVERERRELKQFVVVQGQPATSVPQ